MEITLTLPKPHVGQRQVLDSNARWRILMCGRRWGKSQVAQIIAIQKMLYKEHIAYITPTFDLAKNFFNQILKVIPSALIASDNKSELQIHLITGGSIKFFSGESLDRLRGYKFHYVIIDEAAYIPDLQTAWNSSIRPTLSDYQGGALFISTPRGYNFFYSLFLKGQNKEEGYESFRFSSNENPYFPDEEFEAAKKETPRLQFEQEYLAIPSANQSNPFGDSIKPNIITELSTQPTVVYGVDLAKYSDYTVITGLDAKGYMNYYDRFQLSWEQTKQRVLALPNDIPIYVDSTGVGDVVVEMLQNEKMNVNGFKFTQESKPKIITKLINDVEKGDLKYIQPVADEMEVFEYIYTSTGHIKYQAQAGFHDDCIMSLAIANFHREQVRFNENWSLYFV
jgi:hypothetical protein